MVDIRKGAPNEKIKERFNELVRSGVDPTTALKRVGTEEHAGKLVPQPQPIDKGKKVSFLESVGKGFVKFADWAGKTKAGSGFDEVFGDMGPPRRKDNDPFLQMSMPDMPDMGYGGEMEPKRSNKKKKRGQDITIHIRR